MYFEGSMLDFAQDAIDEIARQISRRNVPGTKLRIGVRGGGCSGFSYIIEFHDGPPSTRDQLFERVASDGTDVTILVDRKSLIMLVDTRVEWENTLLRKGFRFVNPNAKSTCSCGSSFSA